MKREKFARGDKANLPEFRPGQIWEAKKRTPYDSTRQVVLAKPYKNGWWYVENSRSGMAHENFLRRFYFLTDRRFLRNNLFVGDIYEETSLSN
jgi:hypothetical protein